MGSTSVGWIDGNDSSSCSVVVGEGGGGDCVLLGLYDSLILYMDCSATDPAPRIFRTKSPRLP